MFGLGRNISGVDSEGIRPNRNAVRIPHAGTPIGSCSRDVCPNEVSERRSGAAPPRTPVSNVLGYCGIRRRGLLRRPEKVPVVQTYNDEGRHPVAEALPRHEKLVPTRYSGHRFLLTFSKDETLNFGWFSSEQRGVGKVCELHPNPRGLYRLRRYRVYIQDVGCPPRRSKITLLVMCNLSPRRLLRRLDS